MPSDAFSSGGREPVAVTLPRLQEMLNFIRSCWFNAFPRDHWLADFLKVTSVLGGREKQIKHRIFGLHRATNCPDGVPFPAPSYPVLRGGGAISLTRQ